MVLLSAPSLTFAIGNSVRNYNVTLVESVIVIIFSSTFVKICLLVQKYQRRIHKQHRHLEGLLPSLVSYCLCCLTSKRVLQRARFSNSSVKSLDLLFSLRSSSRCLRHLSFFSPVPSAFPAITCFRRHFLRKMRQIQLAFLRFILCEIFLSSWTLYALLQKEI